MHGRAEELITLLGLEPHPEGGYYREVFRSARTVRHPEIGEPRAALTAIYFLVVAGGPGRWHRLGSDEVWCFLEGDALELYTADAAIERCVRAVLGPAERAARPLYVVPAGSWQAARTTGAYTLVSCVVGPGFEFVDFGLLAGRPEAESFRERFPEVADLV